MNYKACLYCLVVVLPFSLLSQDLGDVKNAKSILDFVNPFIGTGGHGHIFPGAVYPFGMMQLSPDARLEGWDGCSGYHYTDSIIYGFSHTHLSGTGVPDYCDILFMPGNGKVNFNNGSDGKDGYASVFKKSNEIALPAYYQVFLEKYKIHVRLTVGKRTGMHHYHFSSSKGQWLLVDLKHRDPLIRAGFTKFQQMELEGFRISKAWAKEQHIYFKTKFSKKIKDVKFNEDSLIMVLYFEDDGNKDLIAQVAISAVDALGAQKNMDAEFSKFNFAKQLSNTQKKWNELLTRIQVKDDNTNNKVIFYTALYHNLIHPSLFQDIDGRYRGMDMKIHSTISEDHYTVFSLWDTYRSTHPLYQWIYPEYNSKFIRTFLRHYQECGHLPIWELAGNETWCMIGNHAIPVIANSFHHKQYDFDTLLAKKAITNSILKGNNSGMQFMKKGFISANEESESVSKTIENSVDFAAARSIGCLLGTPYHSDVYKNVFNPTTGFFQSKLNNKFIEPFNPKEVNHHYTEANAYQYLFGAHHDISGLKNLFSSNHYSENPDQIFRQHLDSLFMTVSEMSGRLLPDVTGLIGQYAHGNEPSHHMAYLYTLSHPIATQRMVERIKNEFYKNAPDGLIGNEDCGQMSSWYIFSALGFYPVNPFDAHYYLGYPSFAETIIKIPNKRKITIKTFSNPGATMISNFKINGGDGNRQFKINAGDNIIFTLGKDHSKLRAFNEVEKPASTYKVRPYVKNGDRVFDDSTEIILSSIQNLPIEYTFDTTSNSVFLFTQPILIKDKTTLFFRNLNKIEKEEWLFSEFSPKPKGLSLNLETDFAKHYSAGGKNALIDGLTGSDDYRDGQWQGFQNTDLNLTIELNEMRPIKQISIRFLQDQPSWILMPEEVLFSCSTDGILFNKIGTVFNKTPMQLNQRVIAAFSLDEQVTCKFIRMQAKNPGKLPEWHPGKGGETWIFADEISIR